MPSNPPAASSPSTSSTRVGSIAECNRHCSSSSIALHLLLLVGHPSQNRLLAMNYINEGTDDKLYEAHSYLLPLMKCVVLLEALENELHFPVSVDSPIITLPKIIIPALVQALEAPTIKLQVQALVALNKIMQIAKTWALDNDEIKLLAAYGRFSQHGSTRKKKDRMQKSIA